MGVMQETDEEAQQAADLLRDRATERAQQALANADETIAAARPWAESAAEWERAAREAREREPVAGMARQGRAAPAPAAPSPSPAAADDDEAAFLARPVRMAVMLRVLQTLVRDERDRAAQTIGELERRIEALEARAADTKKGKRK